MFFIIVVLFSCFLCVCVFVSLFPLFSTSSSSSTSFFFSLFFFLFLCYFVLICLPLGLFFPSSLPSHLPSITLYHLFLQFIPSSSLPSPSYSNYHTKTKANCSALVISLSSCILCIFFGCNIPSIYCITAILLLILFESPLMQSKRTLHTHEHINNA